MDEALTAKSILAGVGEQHQVSLGELISGLRRSKDKSQPVYFDWNHLVPDGLHSYRGYYDQLALSFCDGTGLNVAQLLHVCDEAADGMIFEGYKGGHFKMNKSTRVYVAKWGKCCGVGVVGVEVAAYGAIILRTAVVDDIYQWE